MKIDPQQYIVKELKNEFESICLKNDSFSMRAFAKKLGTNSSTLSEMFSSKRRITYEKAKQFATALNWNNSKLEIIESAYNLKSGLKELNKYSDNKLEENILTVDEYKFMIDWQYFAIIACLRLKDIKPTIEGLSQKLNISHNKLTNLTNELIKAKFISINEEGEIKDLRKCFRTPEDYPQQLHNKRLINSLDGVKKAIESNDVNYYGAYSTISVDLDKLIDAENMIEEFLKKLSIFLSSSDDKTEVMELSINLFSRTDTNKKDHKLSLD